MKTFRSMEVSCRSAVFALKGFFALGLASRASEYLFRDVQRHAQEGFLFIGNVGNRLKQLARSRLSKAARP